MRTPAKRSLPLGPAAIVICVLIMAAVSVHSARIVLTGTTTGTRGARACVEVAAMRVADEEIFGDLREWASGNARLSAVAIRDRSSVFLRRIDELPSHLPFTEQTARAIATVQSAARSERDAIETALSTPTGGDATQAMTTATHAHRPVQDGLVEVGRAIVAELDRRDTSVADATTVQLELLLALDCVIAAVAITLAWRRYAPARRHSQDRA